MSVPCCAGDTDNEYVVIKQTTWGVTAFGPFSSYDKAQRKASRVHREDTDSLCYAVALQPKKNL